jgi:hypothetical protein
MVPIPEDNQVNGKSKKSERPPKDHLAASRTAPPNPTTIGEETSTSKVVEAGKSAALLITRRGARSSQVSSSQVSGKGHLHQSPQEGEQASEAGEIDQSFEVS